MAKCEQCGNIIVMGALKSGGKHFCSEGCLNLYNIQNAVSQEMKKCPFCAEMIKREAIKCKHCGSMLEGEQGNRQAEEVESITEEAAIPAKKTMSSTSFAALLFFLIFGIGGVFFYIYLGNTGLKGEFLKETGKMGGSFGNNVTMSKYKQVTEGMSYGEVKAIMGDPGEELSRSDVAGYVTVMYCWKNPDGSNMNAMFQNDELVTKAQAGL